MHFILIFLQNPNQKPRGIDFILNQYPSGTGSAVHPLFLYFPREHKIRLYGKPDFIRQDEEFQELLKY